jgi:outer membrane protein insertion porin family
MKKSILLASSVVLAYSNQSTNVVEFKNLTQLSHQSAKEIVNLPSKGKLSIEDINSAIKELFRQGYFKDISVTKEGNKIIFKFDEKKVISNIELEGYKSDKTSKEVSQIVGIKKGETYSKKKLKDAIDRVTSLLNIEGKIDSVVEVSEDNINEDSVALTFEVNKGEEIIITDLNLNGLDKLDKSDIEQQIANKEEDLFGWFIGQNDGVLRLEDLKLDSARIKDFYLQKGFMDAQVSNGLLEVDFSSYTAKLNYNIEEGSRYKVKNISLNFDKEILSKEELDELKDDFKLEVDKYYNIGKLRKDIEKIKEYVGNYGYAFVQIEPDLKKDKDNSTTEVVYNIKLNDKVYINDVIVKGNQRTIDRVIRREVFLAPADLYNYRDLKDSKNALRRTGFFEDVVIKEEKVGLNRINLIVNVKEARTGSLVFGLGYGSSDGLGINGSLSDKNLFGSGIGAKINVDASKTTKKYSVSFSNPRLNDSKYSGSVSSYLRDYENDAYKDTTAGFSVSIGKKLTRNISSSVAFIYKDTKQTDEDLTDLIDNNINYKKGSIVPSVRFNNTDDYFLPREGFDAQTSLEYVGIGDVSFMKSNTDFAAYYSTLDDYEWDIIFREKASLSYIVEDIEVPSSERLTLGGLSSVRGYKSGSVYPETSTTSGGLKRFVNSLEMNVPFLPSAGMRATFFYDYGFIGNESFSEKSRCSYGLSIDWRSPLGPLQFIFPRAITPFPGDNTSTFEFRIGSQF